MADTRLTAFVEAALHAGASKGDVEKALAEAGWSQDQISDGLAHYSDVTFLVPVPRPRAQLSARDAFWYLLMFGTLYLSAYNLGDLLFTFINTRFPNEFERDNMSYLTSSIRWATATLIVAFPLFMLAAWSIAREIDADATRRNSAIRKWLTYLTLLVAAAAITGDGIALVNSLLGGEITTRFVLKVLVAALISGSVFGYYMTQMRADDAALKR